MGHDLHAAVDAPPEPEGVVQFPAVVETAQGVDPLEDLLSPHLGVVEVLIPLVEILHTGEDPTRADPIKGREEIPVSPLLDGQVPRRAVGDEVGVVVVEVRVLHSERFEDSPLGELTDRFAAHSLDDHREQEIARVAVEVLLSGWEVELLLPGQQIDDSLIVVKVSQVHPRQVHEAQVVTQSARVMNEMPDGHRRAVVRELRNVLPDVVLDRELSVSLQERDAKRDELLGD